MTISMAQKLPARIPRVSAYISPELKQELERLAYIERRSLSQMVAVLIERGIDKAKQDGSLPPEDEGE